MDDFEPWMSDVPIDEGTGSSTWDVDIDVSDTPWYEDVWNWVSQPGNLSTVVGAASGIYSGVQGMNQASQLRNASQQAIAASDPFGPQRAQYQQQLSQLMANPSSIYEDEGYQASLDQGIQAVTRRNAAGGYLGSGNLMTELSDYGRSHATEYANQRIAQLSTLAGAGISPNPGAGLSGLANSSDIYSQALASMGYGVGRAVGGVTGGGASAGTPQSGGFSAAGGEAAQAIKLAQLGTKGYGALTGADTSAVKSGLGDASSALGIYQGVQEGGVGGYLKAAKSGYNLYNSMYGAGSTAAMGASVSAQFGSGVAANTALTEALSGTASSGATSGAGAAGGAMGGLGTALGVAGALYGGYQTLKAWEAGSVKGGAISGASTGAAIGTMVVPGIGTVVGGLIGGAVGAIGGALGHGESKQDPIKNAYLNAANQNQVQLGVLGDNEFIDVIRGEFSSGASGLPGRASGTYGRKDAEKFSSDFANKINSAVDAGTITSSDDVDTIYDKVILPWYNEMGGYKREGDVGKLSTLTKDMILRYTSGRPIVRSGFSVSPYRGESQASYSSSPSTSTGSPSSNLPIKGAPGATIQPISLSRMMYA